MICGPCNEGSKKATAGVGAMAKEKIKLTRPPKIIDALQEAAITGRVETFELDLGWERPIKVYVICGKTGGWSKNGGNKPFSEG